MSNAIVVNLLLSAETTNNTILWSHTVQLIVSDGRKWSMYWKVKLYIYLQEVLEKVGPMSCTIITEKAIMVINLGVTEIFKLSLVLKVICECVIMTNTGKVWPGYMYEPQNYM